MIRTFVKRFWLSIVFALLFITSGLLCFGDIPISAQSSVASNSLYVTTYSSQPVTPNILEGVTRKLEKALKSLPGSTRNNSSTTSNESTIEVSFPQGTNLDKAMSDAREAVAGITKPDFVKYPVVTLSSKRDLPIFQIYFYSKKYDLASLTQVAKTTFATSLEKIPGVSFVQVYGDPKPEIRIAFDSAKLAYFGIDIDNFRREFGSNEESSFMSRSTGPDEISVGMPPTIGNVDAIKKLFVHARRGIRVQDVARVYVNPKDLLRISWSNGKVRCVSILIYKNPTGNPVIISNETKELLRKWTEEYDLVPNVKDNSEDVRILFQKTLKSFLEALILVILIILIFLGSFKSSITPVLAIPISLITTFVPMKLFGCSFNTSTLMAFILSVGLVVDDAIVVVENVMKYYAKLKDWREAAIQGTEEILVSIIVMTFTLACVFFPVVFARGVFGSILKEFAITLCSAVIISGVVSLTLSPMLCARYMHYSEFAEKLFAPIEHFYSSTLRRILNFRAIFFFLGMFSMGASFWMVRQIPRENLPQVERSSFEISTISTRNRNLEFFQSQGNKLVDIIQKTPGIQDYRLIMESGSGITVTVDLNSPKDLEKIREDMLKKFNNACRDLNFIVRSSENQNDFNIYLYENKERQELYYEGTDFLNEVRKIPGIKEAIVIASSRVSYELVPDYQKAAELGIDASTLKRIIETLNVNYLISQYYWGNKRYKIVGSTDKYLATQNVLDKDFHFIDGSYVLKIRPGVFIKLELVKKDSNLTNYCGFPSFVAEIVFENEKIGNLVQKISECHRKFVGKRANLAFSGKAQEYLEEKNEMLKMFILSLILIFLILLAQSESIRNTFVIMSTAPLAIFGAILALFFKGTINVYTTIGIITLVGLITKHGILFVNSAINHRAEGKDRMQAALAAGADRLRPVLMTTLAMALGVVPLMLETSPVMEPLKQMALTLFPGITIGTLLVIFVVPCVYTYIGE